MSHHTLAFFVGPLIFGAICGIVIGYDTGARLTGRRIRTEWHATQTARDASYQSHVQHLDRSIAALEAELRSSVRAQGHYTERQPSVRQIEEPE